MKSKIGKIVMSVIFGLAAFTATQAQEDYSTWTNRRNFQLRADSVVLAANVAQYPMLVRLSAANFAGLATPGARASLRFARGATKLKYYVQDWDSTGSNGANVWVLVDTLFAKDSTRALTLYWGKSGAADSSKGSVVFSRTNGFVAAYHMGDGNSAAPRVNTVEPGVNNAIHMPLSTSPFDPQKPGVVGMSDTLRGQGNSVPTGVAAGDYFNIGTLPVGSFPSGQVSISTWTWRATGVTASVWSQLIALGNSPSGSGVDNLVIGKNGTAQPTQSASAFFAGVQNGTTGGDVFGNTPDAPLTSGVWHHIAMAGDSLGALNLYYNGTLRTEGFSQVAQNVARTFNNIGRAPYNDATWRGKVDEVRIANVARSAGWMKLEYETQKIGSGILRFGLSDAPTGVTRTADTLAVTVAWTAPTYTGDSTIKGYTVYSTPGNKSCSTTGAVTCKVTGLSIDTAYTFRVVARTGVGAGAYSAATTPVNPLGTATVPAAPTNVTAVAGNASVAVSWTASASNGGSAITGYTVTAAPGGATCSTTGAVTVTCTVTGLTNNTAYTFTVKAVNAMGLSAASAPPVSATPVVGILSGTDAPGIRIVGFGSVHTFRLSTASALAADQVVVTIQDLHGRTLWQRNAVSPKSGVWEIVWEGTLPNGSRAPTGMYLVRLAAKNRGNTAFLDQTLLFKP